MQNSLGRVLTAVARRPIIIAMTAALAVGLIAAPAAAASSAKATTTGVSAGQRVAVAGHGTTGAPREVDVSALPDLTATAPPGPSRNLGALRRDGTRGPTAPRPTTKPSSSIAPNALQPTRILQNVAGTLSSQSSCGCQPPDSNGALGSNSFVEADNLSLQVWAKSSGATLKKRVSFNTFLGTSDSLSDPRVLYDNAYKRFVLVIIPIPASGSSAPAAWFAVSQTADPTKAWWVYRFTFSGGPYQPGVLLDYPMVGMDADSIIVTTNNFQMFPQSYVATDVWAVAKARAYNGLGIGFPAFGVQWSAHPAVVEGIPQHQDGREYIVASETAAGNGSGFDVYYMTNSSRPDSTTVTFAGSTAGTGASSPNCASQPGGGNCLDALDGRLQAAPHQLNGLVWWTRASGFPLIEYGTINQGSLAVTRGIAFLSGSSNDWNPSIAVSEAGYVFLNWAVDDPGTGLQVSTRVAGLGPGDPVQNLIGVGTTIATGGHGNDFRFGDYSSVQIDAFASGTCPAGRSALVVNEEFDASGQWQMRDARVGFC